jgi:hypothetical protein
MADERWQRFGVERSRASARWLPASPAPIFSEPFSSSDLSGLCAEAAALTGCARRWRTAAACPALTWWCCCRAAVGIAVTTRTFGWE